MVGEDDMKAALKLIRTALEPGRIYRRKDLIQYSSNLDRYLPQLVEEGVLHKVKRGIYACPTNTAFGKALPNEQQLLKTFLRDEHFVVFSLSAFNALGLGTTQLYNERIVVNRKRHGEFMLGGRKYFFHRRMEVPTPKQVTQEYFVMELLNRLNELAEDQEAVLAKLKDKLPELDNKKLLYAKKHYATYSAQLKFEKIYTQKDSHAA
jgi:hypothetical protein